ncbi:hypothetical protein RhiXN_05499 [Rhizoctonia solani]|uniref:Uncharacterized protein n=1 Tax=Rhizoctonia solani TaxID=456999 RepID=A0A8H8NW66_9AGAM|nr:uncharacterized protein RhiXN_05499 [Rhizoctonia solani]QRW20510.1 hypothetical protein RhiXN_05499 [Rhizoctonia solani]
MPIFNSINALAYNPCLNIVCYIMNSPEEMRAHLESSANIIHALISASSCNKVRFFKCNVYKHPKWGFLYWLDPRGEEGPDTLYEKRAYCWWNFIASHPGAFRDLAQWHRHGFATPPPQSPHLHLGPTSLHKQASNASDPSSTARHSQANRGTCTSTLAHPPVLQHARHLLDPKILVPSERNTMGASELPRMEQ